MCVNMFMCVCMCLDTVFSSLVFSVLRVVLRKVFFTFSVCLMSYVINKVMWCVKRLCVVSLCVCILLCVYVYVMFNVVCCVLRVVVPGETGVVTAGMRSSAVARARPGTPAQGSHQSSHTGNTSQHHVLSNHYCVDEK